MLFGILRLGARDAPSLPAELLVAGPGLALERKVAGQLGPDLAEIIPTLAVKCHPMQLG